MHRIAIVLTLLAVSGAASGQAAQVQDSPYVDEVSRAVKSLSSEDLAVLRRGGGWGLAKAAELNGIPGPVHLLELKDEIPLTPEQFVAVTEIYERMRAEAIVEGERFIAREQALEDAFRTRTVTEESLREMLGDIEWSRARLRFIHLAAHLGTPALLTEDQLARYDALRGYRVHHHGTVHKGHRSTRP